MGIAGVDAQPHRRAAGRPLTIFVTRDSEEWALKLQADGTWTESPRE